MIRPAGPADAGPIADLELDNLGADAWSATLVAAGVNDELPTVSYLVAEVDGRVVGYAAACVGADIAVPLGLGVARAHRRAGLATALLEGVLSLARGGGADRVLLEVRVDNAGALAFYAAAGFSEIDRRRRYYRDGATAVVLLRPLDV